ncbi:type II toxin-antitoxin system VapC family toxin [Planctomycetota bacterium]
MNLVIDTSAIIAVITNEKHKKMLIEVSKGSDLIAPSSLHWEIGNAFSAMFKRDRIDLKKANKALSAYSEIPIQFYEVDLKTALSLCSRFNLYAYDAYIIECAIKFKSPLLTLDSGLIDSAEKAGVKIQRI